MNPGIPPLPELPPMASAQPAKLNRAPMAPQSPWTQPMMRRMRQIVGMIAGGGLVLTVALLFFELIAKDGLRPTDLAATFEARIEQGVMNQKMGEAPGVLKMTDADYQKALAEAQRAGQTAAELEFQKKLAVVQAQKERIIGAYETLYQRANLIAQAAVQME